MQECPLQVVSIQKKTVDDSRFTGPLVEQSMDAVKQVFDTNTFSILRVCKAVVPIMAKRHRGTIINIGSVMGEM